MFPCMLYGNYLYIYLKVHSPELLCYGVYIGKTEPG